MGKRFALVALMVLVGGPARAYVRATTPSGAAWHWTRTRLRLEAYVGDTGPGLAGGDRLAAVRGAARAWTHDQLACSAVEIVVTGHPEATAPIARDGVNRLVFRRDQWCPDPRAPDEPCHSAEAMALTTDVVDVKTGAIVEADIEVNAVDFVWSDLVAHPGTSPSPWDLQNALTHELGHFLGFAHSCLGSPDEPGQRDDRGDPVPFCGGEGPEAAASTMVARITAGDTDRRTLTDDDQRGVCDVYPIGLARGVIESDGVAGGCALGRPAAPSCPGVVAVALLVLWRRLSGAGDRRRRPALRAATVPRRGWRAAGADRPR